ncbi:hypothetical protein DFJ73DRAFT_797943 [Zopfochytrium polystomum]|nr:hypothetical protein DFJ73DRAFT_797943 [Zopfochytrium polystomum]
MRGRGEVELLDLEQGLGAGCVGLRDVGGVAHRLTRAVAAAEAGRTIEASSAAPLAKQVPVLDHAIVGRRNCTRCGRGDADDAGLGPPRAAEQANTLLASQSRLDRRRENPRCTVLARSQWRRAWGSRRPGGSSRKPGEKRRAERGSNNALFSSSPPSSLLPYCAVSVRANPTPGGPPSSTCADQGTSTETADGYVVTACAKAPAASGGCYNFTGVPAMNALIDGTIWENEQGRTSWWSGQWFGPTFTSTGVVDGSYLDTSIRCY